MAQTHENIDPIDSTPEQMRVHEFSQLLENGLPVSKFDLDLPQDEDDKVYAAIKTLFTPTESLALDTRIYKSFDAEKPVATVSFQPRRARSGKKSMHGVFFGDIELSTGDTIGVAVKPHDIEGNTQSALTDIVSCYAAEDLGFYTLQPFGVILRADSEMPAYSLTILDEGLSTFDSVDWSNYAANTQENPGMQDLWRSIAGQIAVLHDTGQASHGDLAARNIAISGEGGAFLIDWEKARFSGNPPRDAEVRYQHSYGDLSCLLESMANAPTNNFKPGIGLFGSAEKDWWPTFCEVFYDDYVIAREMLASKGTHNRARQSDITEELEALRESLKSDCKMFREINATPQLSAV